MSTLEIDTGNGNVLDCVQVVEDVVIKHGDEIDAICWQRLRYVLEPDREEVAWKMFQLLHFAGDLKIARKFFEARKNEWLHHADAAIRAMGKTNNKET